MTLAENLHFRKSASIAFDGSNANMGKKLHSNFAQTHITNRKSKHARCKKPYVPALFLLGDIFAVRMRYNLVMLGAIYLAMLGAI